MPKKNKEEFITHSEFEELKEHLIIIKDKQNKFEKLEKGIKTLEKDFKAHKVEFEDTSSQLNSQIEDLKQKLVINHNQIQEHVKNQEEIIMDMIKKFNNELLNYKTNYTSGIEEIKSEVDVLKISYTINENKLLEKVEDVILEKIKETVKGKEKEVLMEIWIEELKTIINNFERLKVMKPKEFALKLNEISNTIKLFKQELQI
ncbi:MAG: hypothetical protein GF317_06715 [Candidatus Lokiarchaeota archaeon]|nr:hypothetical protein [Candidatus Lokiarchaeota archaeon]